MTLLPVPDTLGIPASINLVEMLYVFADALHRILFGLALGGSLVIAVQCALSRYKPLFTALNSHLISLYPLVLILAFSSYALPTVFYQGLHGHLFFSSTIEMGSQSLLIPLAIAAAATFALASLGRKTLPNCGALKRFAVIGAILLFKMALITHHGLIAQYPEWAVGIPADIFLMRFFQSLAVAVALSGVAVALLGYCSDVGERGTVYGFRLAIPFTVLGACIHAGLVWMRLSGMEAALLEPPVTPVALTISGLLFIAVTGSALLGIMRPRNHVWGYATAIAMVIAIGFMSYAGLRETGFNAVHGLGMTDIPVRWQTGLTFAFFIILAAGLAALSLMVHFLRQFATGHCEGSPSIDF